MKQNGRILFVKHKSLFGNGHFWCPPGGGLNLGESLADGLCREFLEETGLTIIVGKLLKINEFIKEPIHSIEFFYEVESTGGNLKMGHDPELEQQLIVDLEWLSLAEIEKKQAGEIHDFFKTELDFE